MAQGCLLRSRLSATTITRVAISGSSAMSSTNISDALSPHSLLSFAGLLLVACTLADASAQSLEGRTSLSPAEAATLNRNDVVFLDVRTKVEWRRGHVKGATHIPHNEAAAHVSTMIPDKSKPIITYCAVGGRASWVVNDLTAKGYTVIPVTGGGYSELIAAGMPDEHVLSD
jgi:rhodanese-related sulfurtransferase